MLRITVAFALVAALLAGCASVPALQPTSGPGQTGQPATQAPGSTTNPSTGPTEPPSDTSAPGSSSALCSLTSASDLNSIFGGTWTEDTTSGDCTWTNTDDFTSLDIRLEDGSDFTGAQVLLGTLQQLTIAGHPAVLGDFLGPLLYVQIQPNVQLVIQGVLMGTDDATHQRVVDLATAIIGRM